MNFKPGDFFFTVFEFFAILIPGAILGFYVLCQTHIAFPLGFDQQLSTLKDGVIFIILSYIGGHFLHHLSAIFFNPIYKRTYYYFKSQKFNYLFQSVENDIRSYIPKYTEYLRMAEAFIKAENGTLAFEIDRNEAISKLFRGLALLFICFAFFQNNIQSVLLMIVLVFLSFWKFAKLRFQRELLINEFFYVLMKNRKINGFKNS
jgi:hypothetical protein